MVKIHYLKKTIVSLVRGERYFIGDFVKKDTQSIYFLNYFQKK